MMTITFNGNAISLCDRYHSKFNKNNPTGENKHEKPQLQ